MVIAMNPTCVRIKTVLETKLGRELLDSEVEEIELWFRQLAALIQEWAGDEGFRQRLAALSETEDRAISGKQCV